VTRTTVYVVVEWVKVEGVPTELGGEPQPRGVYLSLGDAEDSVPRRLRTEDWAPVPDRDAYSALPYEIWPSTLIA
jgi:hypothetical protein